MAEGEQEAASSAKKSSAGKSTAKKTSARKSSPRKRASTPRAEPNRRASGTRIASEAARQLAELTGKDVEGVTGLQKEDDGWRVEVELLELRRVPTTTDVLATYEVDVDASGDLQGYRRTRRYVRGKTEGAS